MFLIKCRPKFKTYSPHSTENEQITRPESTTKTSTKTAGKTKDPRKHNKKSEGVLKRELKREAGEGEAGEGEGERGGFNSRIPNTSFTTVLIVIGIGLTVFDLYMRYRTKKAIEIQHETGNVQPENTKSQAEIRQNPEPLQEPTRTTGPGITDPRPPA